MNRSVSLLILNYNGREQLKRNLPSIIDNLDPAIPTEIIVVDNHSTDDSLAFLKASFPQVKIAALDKNYEFSRGFNEGVKVARSDLLFLLNNDIQASRGFITPLVRHFDDPNVFGVSPRVIRPAQGMINESVITGSFSGGVITAEFSLAQNVAVPEQALEVFSVCGAAMMLDREKFLELGGLDEMLRPFYYEETDLSYRALKSGWKIYYEPASTVFHQHNQTIGKHLAKSKALWSYRKNQYLTVWKNITDPWLLGKHIVQMIIPKLVVPNRLEWQALFGALKQLPQALKQRRVYPLSDRAVFRLAAAQVRAIKLKARIKNILVIRPDAIGDLVLTLPAIRALRKYFPKAKITALIREYTRPVLANDPDINELIYDYDLGKHKFDLSVNFYNQFKDTFAAWRAGIPYRLGDSARVLTGWMNNLRVFRRWNDLTRHEIEFNLDLLAPLAIRPDEIENRLSVDPAAQKEVEQLLQQAVGVHIGAGGSHNKAWNNDGYSRVIDWLSKNQHTRVVLTGADDARERAEKIVALCDTPPLNLVGKLPLSELIALTSKYKFYFGPDTGPTHIAAALGVPLVALFLSKRAKPLRWGPWGTRHLIVRNFSKCEKACDPPNCRENIVCTEEVDPEEVIAACATVLAGGGFVGGKDSLYHWCQRSFSIAILHDNKTEDRARQLLKLLETGGYRAYLITEKDPRELLQLFIKYDTSIIHQLDARPRASVLLAQQLTGSYLSNRALLVKDKRENFKDVKELIDLYINRSRATVL